MKPDEAEFRAFVLANDGEVPFDYWNSLTKRQYYLLGKWTRKGWWEYGVSTRGGWLTEMGKKVFGG